MYHTKIYRGEIQLTETKKFIDENVKDKKKAKVAKKEHKAAKKHWEKAKKLDAKGKYKQARKQILAAQKKLHNTIILQLEYVKANR